MIPYSRQYIDKEDIKKVVKVLKSELITQGKQVPLFEKKVSSLVKAKYGVSTNSATSALHIACLALGLKKNDILWTVPNTFVASANCALYCHAKIDFVDINENTLNISIESLEKKLKIAKKKIIFLKLLSQLILLATLMIKKNFLIYQKNTTLIFWKMLLILLGLDITALR